MLKTTDNFTIEYYDVLSPLHYEALYLMYQPLIGPFALNLYQTSLALNKVISQDTHQILIDLTKFSLLEFVEARAKLEAYGLWKTYYDGKSKYVYQLFKPLLPNEFLSHYAFGLEYRQIFGLVFFETLKAKYLKTSALSADYHEISANYDASLIKTISDQELKSFLDTSQKNPTKEVLKTFDEKRFFKGVSNTVFPKSLRTNENLALIAQLISLYGFSYQEMLVMVVTSIDIEKGILDQEKLLRKVRSKKIIVSEESGYDMAPMAFLQKLQSGLKVNRSDQLLLEELANEIGLKPQVINVLIEDIFKNNQKMLVKNYVLKRATTLKLNKVENSEAALKFIKETSFQPATKKASSTIKKAAAKRSTIPQTADNDNIDKTALVSKLRERFKENEEN